MRTDRFLVAITRAVTVFAGVCGMPIEKFSSTIDGLSATRPMVNGVKGVPSCPPDVDDNLYPVGLKKSFKITR